MNLTKTMHHRSRIWPSASLLLFVVLAGCTSARHTSSDISSPKETNTTRTDSRAISEEKGTMDCCATKQGVLGSGEQGASKDLKAGNTSDGLVEETVVARVPPPGPAPEGMVWIPPGKFSMGSSYPVFEDARPIHTVEVDGFWMDVTPVTNAQFRRFVEATGYQTVAERKPDPKDFPGVPEDKLVPGSLVFTPPAHPVSLDDVSQWWTYVPGANWQHPEGPKSDLKGRENHPVVQVCYEDALAYARWAGKRIPTEAEWEYASRGGLTQMPYVWGRTFLKDGKHMANTFQGTFPNQNIKTDGYDRTSPVRTYPPNNFGLYDMAGNVWEWCADWYRPDYYKQSPRKNPKGPDSSYDPDEPGQMKRVQRGGSFLCTDQYCSRYMAGGRGKGAVDTGASHVGFRCVRN